MRLINDTQVTSTLKMITPVISLILLIYSIGFIAYYWFSTLYLLIILGTYGTVLLPGIIPFYSLFLWGTQKLNFRQKIFHFVALFCAFILIGTIVSFENKVNVDGYNSLVVNQLAKQMAVIAIVAFFLIQLGRYIYVCKDRTKP